MVQVGRVNRRGQQNEVFATLMDLTKQFEAFDDIYGYAILTSRSDT